MWWAVPYAPGESGMNCEGALGCGVGWHATVYFAIGYSSYQLIGCGLFTDEQHVGLICKAKQTTTDMQQCNFESCTCLMIRLGSH